MDFEVIKNDLKEKLKPKRYSHTLGVEKFAVKLAEFYDVNQNDAKVAALLHDYCKYESDEAILSAFKTHEIEVDSIVKRKPNLGHGHMAALVLKSVYPEVSDEALQAIERHTFGHINMTQLDKIIYVADALEESRTYDGVEELRALALVNLDFAVIKVSENTIQYELEKGHMIHIDTIKMRNALLEEN